MDLERAVKHPPGIEHPPVRRAIGALLLAALTLGGCDFIKKIGSDTTPRTTPAKPKVLTQDAPSQSPEKPMTTAHAIQLTLSPPVETSDCFVTMRPAVGQVPPVLQITSYASAQNESYPSVYIRAVPPASQLRDLVEQTIAAKIFVTREANGPVWETSDDKPAQIMIKAVDGSRAIGTIQSGTLLDRASGQQQAVTGRFEGAVR